MTLARRDETVESAWTALRAAKETARVEETEAWTEWAGAAWTAERAKAASMKQSLALDLVPIAHEAMLPKERDDTKSDR